MSRRSKLLQKLKDQEYRAEFLDVTVRGGIAYQMQALRRQHCSSQHDFATRVGKKQTQISRLESTEYGGVTVQTLIDIANSLGIGLIVRFVDLREMIDRTEDMADAALRVVPIEELALERVAPVDLRRPLGAPQSVHSGSGARQQNRKRRIGVSRTTQE